MPDPPIPANDKLPGIGGSGIISSTDPLLDDTPALWALTAQGKNPMSFSSTAIPAPAGAALLGLCLLGFSFARRHKKAH